VGLSRGRRGHAAGSVRATGRGRGQTATRWQPWWPPVGPQDTRREHRMTRRRRSRAQAHQTGKVYQLGSCWERASRSSGERLGATWCPGAPTGGPFASTPLLSHDASWADRADRIRLTAGPHRMVGRPARSLHKRPSAGRGRRPTREEARHREPEASSPYHDDDVRARFSGRDPRPARRRGALRTATRSLEEDNADFNRAVGPSDGRRGCERSPVVGGDTWPVEAVPGEDPTSVACHASGITMTDLINETQSESWRRTSVRFACRSTVPIKGATGHRQLWRSHSASRGAGAPGMRGAPPMIPSLGWPKSSPGVAAALAP